MCNLWSKVRWLKVDPQMLEVAAEEELVERDLHERGGDRHATAST